LGSSSVQTIDSRLWARYPHPFSTARTGSIACSTASALNTRCAIGIRAIGPIKSKDVNPISKQA